MKTRVSLKYFVNDCKSSLVYQTTLINLKPITISLWFFTLLNVCTETVKIDMGSSPNFVSNIKRV